jgi:DNA helicase-2/ATP-dependent DNA helicase PcrA
MRDTDQIRQYLDSWDFAVNDEQLAVIAAVEDGTNEVIVGEAVPGSGKTSILVASIHHLMHGPKKVSPKEILNCTFNAACAETTRKRLASKTASSPDSYRRLSRTCHSVGWEVCRGLGFKEVLSSGTEVLSETIKQYESLYGRLSLDIHAVKTSISYAKNRGCYVMPDSRDVIIDPSTPDKIGVDKSVLTQLLLCYELAKGRDVVDFDDQLNIPSRQYELYKMGIEEKNPFVVFKNIRYLFLDELQDFNLCQMKMVEGIREASGCKVVGVGDRDQSIYAWRGANVRNIEQFSERFDAKIYPVTKNYRSDERILEAASTIIRRNKGREGYSIQAGRSDGDGMVVQVNCSGSNDEASAIISVVRSLVGQGCRHCSIFIIGRTNSVLSNLARAMSDDGIPVTARLVDFENEHAQLLNCLAAVAGHPNANMREALKLIKFIGPKRSEAVTAKGVSLDDIDPSAAGRGAIAAKLGAFVGKLLRLRSSPGAKKVMEDEGVFAKTCHAVKDILSGMSDEYSRQKAITIRSELDAAAQYMVDMAAKHGPAAAVEKMYAYEELDLTKERLDSVELMTAHGSKGLENENVIIIDGNNFPCSVLDESDELYHQEGNLLFVAMTRAKKRLIVSRYPKLVQGKGGDQTRWKVSDLYDDISWTASVSSGSKQIRELFPPPSETPVVRTAGPIDSKSFAWPKQIKDYDVGEGWSSFKERVAGKFVRDGMIVYPNVPEEGWHDPENWGGSFGRMLEQAMSENGLEFLSNIYPDFMSKGIKPEGDRNKLHAAWVRAACIRTARSLGPDWRPVIFQKRSWLKYPVVQKDVLVRKSPGDRSLLTTETYGVASLVLSMLGHPRFSVSLHLRLSNVNFSIQPQANSVLSFLRAESRPMTGPMPVLLWRGEKTYAKSVKAGDGYRQGLIDLEPHLDTIRKIEGQVDEAASSLMDLRDDGLSFNGHLWVAQETDCLWPIHPREVSLVEHPSGKTMEAYNPVAGTKDSSLFDRLRSIEVPRCLDSIQDHAKEGRSICSRLAHHEMDSLVAMVYGTSSHLVTSERVGRRTVFSVQRGDPRMTIPPSDTSDRLGSLFGTTVKIVIT